MRREYRDVTSNTGLPTSTAYPTRDENGNLLTTEFGMCVYKNHQVITIQVSHRPIALFINEMADAHIGSAHVLNCRYRAWM